MTLLDSTGYNWHYDFTIIVCSYMKGKSILRWHRYMGGLTLETAH